jgi:Ca2+-transporting ATPase
VEKTPLTTHVDRLTIFMIIAALFAFLAIVVMGLRAGDSSASCLAPSC